MGKYKVFRSGMYADNKQFEVGETYTEDFDFYCDTNLDYKNNALDMVIHADFFDYRTYEPNEFASVTPVSGVVDFTTEDDITGKFAAHSLKIDKKVDFEDIAKEASAALKKECFEKRKVISERMTHTENSDFGARLMINGDCSTLVDSACESKIVSDDENFTYAGAGTSATVICNEKYAELSSSGESNTFILFGEGSRVAAGGGFAKIACYNKFAMAAANGGGDEIICKGDDSALMTGASTSHILSEGDRTVSVSLGVNSSIESRGYGDVVVNISENGVAKGKKGTFITLAEYKPGENAGEKIPVCVRTEQVDGSRIKEDTWYTLIHGKFVEVK